MLKPFLRTALAMALLSAGAAHADRQKSSKGSVPAVGQRAPSGAAAAKPERVTRTGALRHMASQEKDPYAHIGGMASAKATMRLNVLLPLLNPELFRHMGHDAPTGTLVYGGRGMGKSEILHATGEAIKAAKGTYVYADARELPNADAISEFMKQVEEQLEDGKNVVAVVDEIHHIAKPQDVARLKDHMESLNVKYNVNREQEKGKGRVVFLAATNEPDKVDAQLRRKGTFEASEEIKAPTEEERLEILSIKSNGMKLKGVDLKHIAKEQTRGWSGSDLTRLVAESLRKGILRTNPKAQLTGAKMGPKELAKYEVRAEDVKAAHKVTEPESLRNFAVDADIVHWTDVGGLEDVKGQLQSVLNIIRNPARAKEMGVQIPRGVVLHGPPGNGKTMLAKAMATESGMNLIVITPEGTRDGLVGSTEKNLAVKFEAASQHAPTIVFVDEAESLLAARGSRPGDPVHDTTVNMALSYIDGIKSNENVFWIIATNRPDLLDEAITGPGGRLRKIPVGKPNPEARAQIFASNTKKMKLKDVNFDSLTRKTEGWAGRAIKDLCVRAGELAFADPKATAIEQKHFQEAYEEIRTKIDEKTGDTRAAQSFIR